MTLDEIKRISIRQYLKLRDIKPIRENEGRGMYISPLRKDTNASLSVNYARNLWYDHGTGRGGSIIDLVAELESCSINEAIRKLENESFSFHGKNTFVPDREVVLKQAISIANVIPLINPALLAYLNERKISLSIAKDHCREIHYRVNDKSYFAIGFKNDKGGYELRNKYFKGCTTKDITTIGTGKENCLLFEGFMDYLSFLTINKLSRSPTDVIVLNTLSNLQKIENYLPQYKSVSAFLDNDEAGKKAFSQIKSLSRKATDYSGLYRNYKDLNEYLNKEVFVNRIGLYKKKRSHSL